MTRSPGAALGGDEVGLPVVRLSAAELRYLRSERRLGRLATSGPDGQPHVVPVGWSYDEVSGTFEVSGRQFAATQVPQRARQPQGRARRRRRAPAVATTVRPRAGAGPSGPTGFGHRSRGQDRPDADEGDLLGTRRRALSGTAAGGDAHPAGVAVGAGSAGARPASVCARGSDRVRGAAGYPTAASGPVARTCRASRSTGCGSGSGSGPTPRSPSRRALGSTRASSVPTASL